MECKSHDRLTDALDSINAKLDLMMERQLEYSNRLVKLEGIVTNGLSHNVVEIREKIEKVCESYGKRLAVLESFSWFRNAVSNLRDNLFINLIKLAVIGGSVYLVAHFGTELLKMVLK